MNALSTMRRFFVVLALLTCPVPLIGSTIISVTSPPALSFGGTIFTSWSQSSSYTDVTIAALVDAFLVGNTPTALAFLTTRIGPGTTSADEIAHARFTVPPRSSLTVCSSSSCGAFVTWFSGLSLGPGTYFLTMAPDPQNVQGGVGWFPAFPNPTVLKDVGVSEGASFIGSALASYPPASSFVDFRLNNMTTQMSFIVTGTETPVPEPATPILLGSGVAFLLAWRCLYEHRKDILRVQ